MNSFDDLFTHRLEDILEAALLAASEPLALERFESLFDEHELPPRAALRSALARLEERHDSGALELIETASGFQLRIRQRLSPWVSRLWEVKPQRYSRALLETLALIAYRQPVTRSDIEEIRGVAVSTSIMRTLLERQWIRVVGQRDVPGRPSVYATTRQFLDDFGLKTLDGLPPMHELKAFTQEPAPSATLPLALSDNTVDETSPSDQPDGSEMNSPDVEPPKTQQAGLSFADLEARLAERHRAQASDEDSPTSTYSTNKSPDS